MQVPLSKMDTPRARSTTTLAEYLAHVHHNTRAAPSAQPLCFRKSLLVLLQIFIDIFWGYELEGDVNLLVNLIALGQLQRCIHCA